MEHEIVVDGSEGSSIAADTILSSEYDYISQSAFQANEDRARVSTYYIVTFGTLVAAMFSLQVGSQELANIHRALVVLFVTLTVFGLSTLLQLVRLRQAWMESIRALNQIKAFYLKQHQDMRLEAAFLWGPRTVPSAYKPWSIAFLLALQVALLGGVSLGAAVYFLSLLLGGAGWTLPVVAGSAYIAVQIGLYRYLLR
ncbi:MAG: hypothetical protein R3293_04210 [Candidatus Promineifilaceae bacterium]|nr:hypothetical protein [Candidatus Promineifilaceae bacterium]